MLKRRLAGLAVAAALVGGGVPAVGQAAQASSVRDAPVAVASKSCSGGRKHAVIGGEHKCLGPGQFCARRNERIYKSKGFTCKSGRLRYR